MATITGMTSDKIKAIVAMSPIVSQVLAAPAASVTFSAIPATFKHLKLRVSRPAFAAADYTLVQLNNDTTIGNYFFGSAGAVGAATTPGFPPFKTNAFVAPAGFDLDILSYSSGVLQKIMLASAAAIAAVNEERVGGGWNQASVVTAIKILSAGGQMFPIGSEFDLYGVN